MNAAYCWLGADALADIPFFITFVFVIFPAAALASAALYCRRAEKRLRGARGARRMG